MSVQETTWPFLVQCLPPFSWRVFWPCGWKCSPWSIRWLSVYFAQTFIVPRGWPPMFPFCVSLGLPCSSLKWNISTTVYPLAMKSGTEVHRRNPVDFGDHLPFIWCHQKVSVFMNKHRRSWFTWLSLFSALWGQSFMCLTDQPTLDNVMTTRCLWAG